MSDDDFLRTLHQRCKDVSLDPGDPRYVELYDKKVADVDPVRELQDALEWAETESAHLFSGFRGTGKSTQLRRLHKALRAENACAVLLDMEAYVNLTTPIDVSDFLIAICGALGEALAADDLLGHDVVGEGYWGRFVAWLQRTKVDLEGIDVAVGPSEAATTLRLNLRQDPTFRQRLQDRMKGHVGPLVADARQFVEKCAKDLRDRHGEQARLIVLVDSMEKIRGTSINESEVTASLEVLFAGHADKLRLPYAHVVYTVPPWLKVRANGIAGSYDSDHVLPCVKVRNADGTESPSGLALLDDLLSKRGDWHRLLPDEADRKRLLTCSGGYLRDLLRLVRESAVRARRDGVPLKRPSVEIVINQLRDDYLPIPWTDAVWLDQVRETGDVCLPDLDALPALARFLEHHLVLCWRNGRERYGVHPIVEDEVKRLAERGRAARARADAG